MSALRIGSTLFILILAGRFVLAAGSADELAKMKGRWKVTSAIMEGEPAKAEETGSLIVVVEADRLTFESDGHNEECRIVLDSSKSPAQIELFPLTAGRRDEKTIHGIYAFEGQTLKLAWTKNGEVRPASFAGQPGEKISVMVLEHAAAGAPATATPDAESHRELGIVLLNVVEYPSDQTQSMIATLLAEGADVNVRSGRFGFAPLHGLAAGTGLWGRSHFELWQEAADALLAAGADINQKTEGPRVRNQTPLHVLAQAAVRAQDKPESAQFVLKAAEFLIQRGADRSIRDASGKTPLDLIGKLDESSFKKDLSDLFSKPPAKAGSVPATRPALGDTRSVAIDLNECVSNVIEYPPDDAAVLIDCLLKAGADPRDGTGTGQILLDRLAFNSGNTWAVSNNDWRHAAAALIKAGADVNGVRSGRTPLDAAVETAALNAEYHHPTPNEIEMVKFLIENGADPTIKDAQGKTARDRAAKISDEKVRQELLDSMDRARRPNPTSAVRP
jgi:uncharacterized protein (TIGR03067 family)